MYILYSLILFFIFVFILPFYVFKKKILKREELFVKERLGRGLPEIKKKKISLWIHAVSVGEVISLQKLVKQLKERHSSWVINFSALSYKGLRIARKKLQGVDNFFFIPLDFIFIVKKYLKKIRPNVFILTESEFWPNLLKEANRKGVPILLINGRMSDHSYKRYRVFKFIVKKVFKNIDYFLVQSEKEKKKLENLGVDPTIIRIAGNLKAEIELPGYEESDLRHLRNELGIQETDKVLIMGSTRRGEEEQLLEAFSESNEQRSDLKLILVPRQLDRVNEVEKICRDYSFAVQKKTNLSPNIEWKVLIIDTMGELAQLYALSNIAFVGGSLVPWGGHNILEPAYYEKPVFFGPHMNNFAFFADKFIQNDAARVINNKKDLVNMFLDVDKKNLIDMGKRAKETLISFKGATEKTLETIEAIIGR